MRAYLIVWVVLLAATLGGWYGIGVLEMGVADGTGVAPAWLRALYRLELVLLWPLGRLALALDPSLGYFRLTSLGWLALAVAINSALQTAAVWLAQTGIRAWLERRRQAPPRE